MKHSKKKILVFAPHADDEAAKINNANKLPNEEEMEKIAREADKAFFQNDTRTENISCTKEEGVRNRQQTLFDM